MHLLCLQRVSIRHACRVCAGRGSEEGGGGGTAGGIGNCNTNRELKWGQHVWCGCAVRGEGGVLDSTHHRVDSSWARPTSRACRGGAPW
jgi:hypothetical protein